MTQPYQEIRPCTDQTCSCHAVVQMTNVEVQQVRYCVAHKCVVESADATQCKVRALLTHLHDPAVFACQIRGDVTIRFAR